MFTRFFTLKSIHLTNLDKIQIKHFIKTVLCIAIRLDSCAQYNCRLYSSQEIKESQWDNSISIRKKRKIQ